MSNVKNQKEEIIFYFESYLVKVYTMIIEFKEES